MAITNPKQQALNFIRSGNLHSALQVLAQTCQRDATDADAWFYLGAVQGSLGDSANAEQSFRRALVLRPDFVQAQLNLGNALRKQGRLTDAEKEYKSIIERVPQHAGAWNALSYLLSQQGKLEEAEQAARHALQRAPESSEAYAALATIALARRDPAEAIRLGRAALERDPRSISALFNLGLAHKAAGQLADAKEFLRRAIDIQPTLVEAHYSLGLILLRESRLNEAESALRRALDHDPRNIHVLEQLGAVLRHLNKREAALDLYRSFVAAFPENADAKFFFAVLSGGEDPGHIPLDVLSEWYRSEQVARSFDQGLTKDLDYVVPIRLQEQMSSFFGSPSPRLQVLDLGCGTGLYGTVIKPWSQRLVGVDLSPVMLEEAKRKGVYDETVEGDLLEILVGAHDQYDLIVAMDVLVFFGDLDTVFERVRRALRPAGVFILDLEKGDGSSPWQLQIFGNYVHSRGYIADVARRHRFSELLCEEMDIRKAVDAHVKGYLLFLRADS